MFDPIVRLNRSQVQKQCDDFRKSEYFSVLFEHIPDAIFVLNKTRQVVYANKKFVNKFGIGSGDDLMGKKPGECVSCLSSELNIDGCGNSRHCSMCGLANAIKRCETEEVVQIDCNILIKGGENFSFTVSTWPFVINSEPFVFCVLHDVTEKLTHQYLERTFLHDIQNSISVLYAIHEVIDELSLEEIRSMLRELSTKLNDEINAYRVISDAEKSTLKVFPESVNIAEMVKGITEELHIIRVFRLKKIKIKASEFYFITDKTLLRRILTNLVKNALEAGNITDPVEITISRNAKLNTCRIDVKSYPLIAGKDQSNIFRKAFSTKGNGRGWGTYGIRLLSEYYLNGKVSFVSNEKERTIFTVELPELKI